MRLARVALVLIALVVSLPVCFAQSMSLTYDANGNLITGDGKFRIYNDLNQLTEVRNGSNASAPLLERYEYHPIEERIWLKDVYDAGVYKETVFYDNENFVQVQNSSGNYATLYVKHEGSLVAQQTGGAVEYLVSDPYGAYKLVTNEFGTVLENTTYEPFGRIIAGGEKTRFDYEDREYSSITGDYDFRFRKYDPHLKIFTQPDTLIPNVYDPQMLNRYAFERNNPYKYNDEDGHELTLLTVGVIAATILFFGWLDSTASGFIEADVQIQYTGEIYSPERVTQAKVQGFLQGSILAGATMALPPLAVITIPAGIYSITQSVREAESAAVQYLQEKLAKQLASESRANPAGLLNTLPPEFDAPSKVPIVKLRGGRGGSSSRNQPVYEGERGSYSNWEELTKLVLSNPDATAGQILGKPKTQPKK